jgi:serine/threonine protein kinase
LLHQITNCHQAITDLKEIGHGSFGEVFKGVYQGKVYAIKKLQLDK